MLLGGRLGVDIGTYVLSGLCVFLGRGEVIKGGKNRISLNWPLNAQTASKKSFFQRALFHHDVIHKAPRVVNDDIWTFNSQVSSQWDGLRHFAYQKEGR